MIGHAVAAALLLGNGLLGNGLVSADAADSSYKPPAPLTSKVGQRVAIPGWDLASSSDVSKDLGSLSKPGVDTSRWHRTKLSRCTIMACLIDAGVYDDEQLFYSDNLNHVNWGQFSVPWLYRSEFALTQRQPGPAKGRRYILETNGITSRADLFLNGEKIADSGFQIGAYGGHAYDITDLAGKSNALVVQAYPTQYLFDFAVGFVDWNPYSPDNGTGVWRDITVKEIGPVSLEAVNVMTDIGLPVETAKTAFVTVRAKAHNYEDGPVSVTAQAIITDPAGRKAGVVSRTVRLAPGETRLIDLKQTVQDPQVWWPRQWGGQPLYSAQVTLSVGSEVSDAGERQFGIRTVTSAINGHNDTQFAVNGHPFQVVGGGYSADIFLRWDGERFSRIVDYMFDMHQNTVRLEGKFEHPELYDIADRRGMLVMAGWECCDKWEAWAYNDELALNPPPVWDDEDYRTASASAVHEADMIQSHPSLLAFLAGSDFWPNDEATALYLKALKDAGWQTPIIASAAKRGYPELLGPSGMKMDGPYDWVPPNYWFDTEPSEERLGAAFGFGSELGAGVGTPEMGSLRRFLSRDDLDDLWQQPGKNLFHMSTNASSFYNRHIYNEGLYKRFGAPASLEDYLIKAQMMDYEATRAQYEGFGALWNADRPATGLIYWMLNNAWPSLHWNQFDYYLHPAGSFFGTKVGARVEHAAYDPNKREVWLINHSLNQTGPRTIAYEIIDLGGKAVARGSIRATAKPNSGFKAASIAKDVGKMKSSVAFLRLVLSDAASGRVLSRNVYWISRQIDVLDWSNATWYYTQVSDFADFTALNHIAPAQVSVAKAGYSSGAADLDIAGTKTASLVLENKSSVPAFFIRLNLVDRNGSDVNPVSWSDNYLTLWPHEKLTVSVGQWSGNGVAVQVDGKNVKSITVKL
ncbi:Exo-beta-D-glucosaminidase [Escovopsis weberi]|uniref:Exo-beta-D-glucosaminidase n=1 Tax=Escovopsis weberi TaxID=150374 RepID=A0A0M9VRZ0_ESCWE|nr:Exo-beta-D-glucosaminidase [Escovopsis weberi]